jgi:hypothetical protein
MPDAREKIKVFNLDASGRGAGSKCLQILQFFRLLFDLSSFSCSWCWDFAGFARIKKMLRSAEFRLIGLLESFPKRSPIMRFTDTARGKQEKQKITEESP